MRGEAPRATRRPITGERFIGIPQAVVRRRYARPLVDTGFVPGRALTLSDRGSGTLQPDRDIDVGVWLEPGIEPSPALGVALDRAAARSVDLIWLDAAPPLLRVEIARYGLVLTARDAHSWPELRARAMIACWDWAPTARMMHAVMSRRLRQEAGHGPA